MRVKDELSLGHAESVGWKDIPRQRPEDIVLLVQTSRTRLTLRLSTLPPSEAGPTQAVGAEQSSDPHALCGPLAVLGWSVTLGPGSDAVLVKETHASS